MKKIFALACVLSSCAVFKTTNINSSQKGNSTMTEKEKKVQHLDYLLEIESPRVAAFISKENELSNAKLANDPLYKKIEIDILNIMNSKDKLPAIFIMQNMVYTYWKDEKNPRGILKRISANDFNHKKNNWELVLDLDFIAKNENKNWIWKNFECSSQSQNLCLVYLSDGGKDATVAREFDLNKKDFVVNGFSFPESKSNFTWVSDNEIIWADATDPNKISASGYPQQLKIIKRHQMLSEATLFAEMPKDYLMAYSFKVKDADKYYHFISYSITGTTTEYYYLPDVKNLAHKIKVPVPVKSQIIGIAYQQVLFKISHSFKANNNDYEAGTILAFDLADIEKSNITYKLVFKPKDNQVLEDILISKHQIWVSVLEDVKPKIYLTQYQKSQWSNQNFTSENDANSWAIATSSVESEHVYLIKSGFLTPNEYLYVNDIHPKISQAQSILKSPSYFNEDDFVVHQYKAKSSDGVEIPYFIVHKKNMHYNSLNPTLLYGYGGFEIPLTPYYSGTLGKAWLERDGVYVYANIRGGGEFGPKWHQSAIRDKKQLSYDDFISIAEDLIRRKITSPKHLGIKGGSNGGLLTSVMLTQRPDLFNAVISAVPLTNMIRFSKLLAGAFWMDEYGNPENETDKKILLEYSPLHNLKDGVKYPEAFFTTSTKDDRVHPGHARQMVARLRELNQNVIYFENTDGGHGGAKNNNEMASLLSMEYVYLFQKLK